MTTAVRVVAWLVLAVVALASAPARAENIKVKCIKANADAQTFRREGKLGQAREQLRMCMSNQCPSLVSADCLKRLDELESVQPTAVFSVVDGQDRDLYDVKVTMDGRVIMDKLEGVAVEVDLGEHELTFSSPGRASVKQKVVFREGEKSRIVRAVMPGAGEPQRAQGAEVVAEAPAPAPAPARDHGPAGDVAKPAGSSRRTIGYVLGGVGIAGLAVGGFFGFRTVQQKNRQVENCESTSSCRNRLTAIDAHEDARLYGLISTVAFVAGAATTGLGVALVLSGPRRDDGDQTAVTLAPSFGPDGAGLSISGAL